MVCGAVASAGKNLIEQAFFDDEAGINVGETVMVSMLGGTSALSGFMGNSVKKNGLKMFYGVSGNMSNYLSNIITGEEDFDYSKLVATSMLSANLSMMPKLLNARSSSFSDFSFNFFGSMLNGLANGLGGRDNSCNPSPIKPDESFRPDSMGDGDAVIGVW